MPQEWEKIPTIIVTGQLPAIMQTFILPGMNTDFWDDMEAPRIGIWIAENNLGAKLCSDQEFGEVPDNYD